MFRNKALLTALLILIGIGSARADTVFPPNLFGGPFSLTDERGNTVTSSDFQGQFMLIYFGYTFCPDICPGDLSRLATALDDTPPGIIDKVQPIFITVDPERDTPDIAGPYAAAFHPKCLGLSGDPDAVKQAVIAYRVHRAKVFPEGAAPEDYLVSHSPNAYLMGPEKGSLTPEVIDRCDHVVRIPTGFCLNVATAGAILMYDRSLVHGGFGERATTSVSMPPPPKAHAHGGRFSRKGLKGTPRRDEKNGESGK